MTVGRPHLTRVSPLYLQVHAKGLVPTPLPSWLEPLASRLAAETAAFGGQAANHVLVNSYFPGEGILVSRHTADLACTALSFVVIVYAVSQSLQVSCGVQQHSLHSPNAVKRLSTS